MYFQKLLNETQKEFDKSDIKKFAIENNVKWNYSISATPLKEGCTVLVGFNWGAGKDQVYEPQSEMPTKSFKELYDINDLGSFQRVYLPLKKYLPSEDIDNCVQTNFCFFRSQTEDQITEEDLKLSTVLFSKLIEQIKPVRIIGFSKKLQAYFTENKLCENIENTSFKSNARTLYVSKGNYESKDLKIPIYFLPHPNAKFTSEARENAWKFCFNSPT